MMVILPAKHWGRKGTLGNQSDKVVLTKREPHCGTGFGHPLRQGLEWLFPEKVVVECRDSGSWDGVGPGETACWGDRAEAELG